MNKELVKTAREYVQTINKIEKTTDPFKLQKLEEHRVQQHWKFIELLKKQGIFFKDREHATLLAIRIAAGER